MPAQGDTPIGEKPVELIKVENQRLRERLAEIEQELGEARRAGAASPQQARLMELLRQKNTQLESSAQELEKKAKDAEKAAKDLAVKNEELTNSMAALRLYQLMFENDPHGLVGVAPDGTIIQFNSSAIRFFGYDLHKLRLQNISGLKLSGTEVDIPAVFAEAMKNGEADPVDCTQENRRVRVTCFRLEDIRGQRGAVFRLSEVRE